jgi:hypothetical protein
MTIKTLNIQLQPMLFAVNLCDLAVKKLKALENNKKLVTSAKYDYGEEDGIHYINITFTSLDIIQLWRTIQKQFLTETSAGMMFKSGSIIVCEGDFGWNDYLLLHHFDPLEKLDKLVK